MKKPLLIGVSALTLLAVSATLFAQTTTGSSLITEMKAAVRVFTLAGDLNPPGTTGLQSAPVSGKKTGDMLTAGEWNRVLELVAQGGGGGGGAGFEVNDTTTKTRYSIIWNGISWANNPKWMGGLGGDYTGLTDCGTYFAGTLTPNCKMIETAAHDFCQIVFTGGAVGHSELNYIGAKKWRIITSGFGNFTSGTIVECYDNAGGGTGGTGGGGLGYGQTWQNMKGSAVGCAGPRISGTICTNNTGKPIQVNVSAAATEGQNVITFYCYAGTGTDVFLGLAQRFWNGMGDSVGSVSFVVPVGGVYHCDMASNLPSTVTWSHWVELR